MTDGINSIIAMTSMGAGVSKNEFTQTTRLIDTSCDAYEHVDENTGHGLQSFLASSSLIVIACLWVTSGYPRVIFQCDQQHTFGMEEDLMY